MADTPKLSLCVITKNEEANLPGCIESVRGVVDEIVVTDSGSTDRTVALARRAGATVSSIVWRDDFSFAYNDCISHAKSEWVLLLDADERLDTDSIPILRRLIKRTDAFAYTVLRRDYFGSTLEDGSYAEMLQTRLFRRRDGLRFVGRIHQQLEPSLSACAAVEHRQVLPSEIRIDHLGYLGDQQQAKLARSIRMLELELAERPGSFYYLVELGRSKLAAGDATGVDALAEAAAMVETGAGPAGQSSPMVQVLIEQLLAADVLPDAFPMTLEKAEESAETEYTDSIPVCWQLARKRFKSGRFEDAVRLLESIRSMASSGRYNKACSFAPTRIYTEAALNLGVCYAHVGRVDDAIAAFESILEDPTHGAAAAANAATLRSLNT